MDELMFAEFCKPYDLRVIEAYQDQTWFNVVHIHGMNVMFDTVSKYPCNVLNWHDRQTNPTLKEARAKSSKVFLGGLREGPAIVGTALAYDSIMATSGVTPADIKKHIQEAIDTPRFYDPSGTISMETRIPEEVAQELEAMGHKVERTEDWDIYYGGAHGVVMLEDGTLRGGADPRRDGKALGY